MLRSLFETTTLSGLLAQRRSLDRRYLMSLTDENLLLPYYQEAGLHGITYLPPDLHNGWDSPLSQIRGTVCGHWLSAAAMIIRETGDPELLARANHIVGEIALCQRENGGEWCFPIPEKYLLWLKRGKHTWAPQYVCHKVLMGLLDMHRFAGNNEALTVVCRAAEWFLRFTADISPDQMAEMMGEETGGIMELWADLYAVTGDPSHLALMRRYERRDLYQRLLDGENPLGNMHANTTIPEIHGAARAYEVTGEERYRQAAEAYWRLAAEEAVPFVTGGQTSGELWTPPGRHAARLGRMNQEHCTVYNMMRLADYLFRWTGESKYADYWEKNFYNGLLAQGFWQEPSCPQLGENPFPTVSGYVAYYLPLHPGAKKAWGSATGDFWCCHCSLLQANAFFPHSLYFQEDGTLFVSQYQDSSVSFTVSDTPIKLEQQTDSQTAPIGPITPDNLAQPGRPDCWKKTLRVTAGAPVQFTLALRRPAWLAGEMTVLVNGKPVQPAGEKGGFLLLSRDWSDDTVTVILPKAIAFYSLPDRPDTGAFLDGPVALAALTTEERTLFYQNEPTEILTPYDERRWGDWQNGWKTTGQPANLIFKPLFEIGTEPYTTYFPLKKIEHSQNVYF
ncbi:MAG: beta-L-arabinofuranosidase domain-containing protein [Candidatus Merdivicinus sp.]|jgi:DUF1680 family protein